MGGDTATGKSGEPAAESARARFMREVADDLPSKSLPQAFLTRETSRPSSLALTNRIGIIGTGGFAGTLAKYADVTVIAPDTPDETIAWTGLDLLLVEGRIMRQDEPWRRGLLGMVDDGDRLHALIARARDHDVPAVLWINEEASALPHFAHLRGAVDLMVVPPGADDTDPGTVRMSPCVDVKLFNPVIEDLATHVPWGRYLSLAVDGCHEIGARDNPEDFAHRFEALFDYNWWLLDSSYDLRNNNRRFPPRMQRRALGPLRGLPLANLLKFAEGYVLPRALTGDRPRHARQRQIEAAAAKALVLAEDSGLTGAATADTPAGLNALIHWLMRDRIGRAAAQHLGWRDAVARHSWFEGIAALLSHFGKPVRSTAPLDPGVNVIMPTIRPELIPHTLRTMEAQVHRNWQLTIVANGVPVPDDIARLVADHPAAQLTAIPGDKSIGYCMNFGIDQSGADYWAKIDDDDIYGPHYLSDLLLQRKYADFDITGKAAVFAWLEESEKLVVRNFEARDRKAVFLTGSTILARDGTGHFPEDVRGYADVLFLTTAEENGRRLLTADPFNYIQVRRADVRNHTWTADAAQFETQGPVRSGLDFSGAIL